MGQLMGSRFFRPNPLEALSNAKKSVVGWEFIGNRENTISKHFAVTGDLFVARTGRRRFFNVRLKFSEQSSVSNRKKRASKVLFLETH